MDIEFKNSSSVFYSGHLVEGHVQLELPEDTKFREIHLKFIGRVKTHRARGNDSEDKGESVYFDHRITLETSESTGEKHSEGLFAGIHVFPFIFQLPSGLPPSFESPLSSIRYFVKATIHRKLQFDETVKRHFTVVPLGPLDLRTQHNALVPVQVKGENVVKKLRLINKGVYTVTAATDKRGYVPGEIIYVSLDIDNTKCRAPILGCIVNLIMSVTNKYDTTEASETEKYQVLSHEIDATVDKGQSDTWCAKLHIPGLTPSMQNLCDLIEVSHYIKIVFQNRHSFFGFKLPHLDIDIGTVPTTQHTEKMSEKEMMSLETASALADIPAPTRYEECFIQSNVNKDDVDPLPVYPYYHIRKQSAKKDPTDLTNLF